MKVLEGRSLVHNYVVEGEKETKEIQVIRGIDLCIEDHERIAIMGRSGCGKTTLLKLLGLIDEVTDGELYFRGRPVKEIGSEELASYRREKIGFVFQDFYLMEGLSVLENIMLPMLIDRQDIEETVKKAENLAKKLQIDGLLEKRLGEISGGEKQRIAIARALIHDPDVILADEPTGNLDSKSGRMVMDILETVNEKWKKTVVIVTHDPQIACRCKRVLLMKDGKIREELRPCKENGLEKEAERIFRKMLEL